MPIYDYRCGACGEEYERMRPLDRMDDGGACPACGSEDTSRRLSTRFAFAGAFDAGVAAEWDRVQQESDDPDAMTTEDFYNLP